MIRERLRRGAIACLAAGLSPLLLLRSLLASRAASNLDSRAAALATFGRRLGIRALGRGDASGLALLLTPIHSVRYWELPFVLRHLPIQLGRCLDVASPRLLSLYVAAYHIARDVTIINADQRDASRTARMARLMGLASVSVCQARIEEVTFSGEPFDAIWSVSVVEHIDSDGDSAAVCRMFDALAPGGRLLLTVPVDRTAWEEFRSVDEYGVGSGPSPQGHFFQRWYDEASILLRLVEPADPSSYSLEWFGERMAGRFASYERRWRRFGLLATANDPIEICRGYAQFTSWADMPGRGVCGIVMEKTA